MRRSLAVAAVLSVCLMSAGQALADGSAAGHVFPPHASPRGMTYAQWLGDYSTWLNEIPTPDNPYANPASPLNCQLRHGVVYLGAFGSDCNVPTGHPLLVGGPFWECSTLEGLGDTWAELHACAHDNFNRDLGRSTFLFTVKIDGKKLSHPRAWTFTSPGEIIRFPDDNIWGAPGGKTKSVSKGILYMLRPLEEGDHVFRIHANFAGGTPFNVDWVLHVS
jgi:hypothetical protein